jgi:hypothetical protein
MFARLVGIDYAAYPQVLHVHDDPDVMCLENVRTCVENMRA